MTVREIIGTWLKENGFTGVVANWGECGCGLDDLGPCDAFPEDCEPGYEVKCDCPDHNGKHYQTKKPEDK